MKKYCLLVFLPFLSHRMFARPLGELSAIHKQMIMEMQHMLERQGYLKYLCCDTTIEINRSDISDKAMKKKMRYFQFSKIIIYGKKRAYDYMLRDSCITFTNYWGLIPLNYTEITIDLTQKKRDQGNGFVSMQIGDKLYRHDGCLLF